MNAGNLLDRRIQKPSLEAEFHRLLLDYLALRSAATKVVSLHPNVDDASMTELRTVLENPLKNPVDKATRDALLRNMKS